MSNKLAMIIHQPGAIGHNETGSGKCISLRSSAGLVKPGLFSAGLFKTGEFILFFLLT